MPLRVRNEDGVLMRLIDGDAAVRALGILADKMTDEGRVVMEQAIEVVKRMGEERMVLHEKNTET